MTSFSAYHFAAVMDVLATGDGDRRKFLAVAVQMAAGTAIACWALPVAAAPSKSPATSRRIMGIDAHTHFYDPTRPQGVPWPPRDQARLYRPVYPKDYRAVQVSRLVTGTVVVEASPWIEDNQWVLDLAEKESFIVGLVGNLPIGTKPFAEHLKRFAANRLFRGIRIRDRKLEGSLDDAVFMADVRRLADHDLALDLVGGSEILPFAERLSKELPSLRIIIDHLAGVRVDGAAPPSDWVAKMKTLIPRKNVYFKISGLVEGTGRSDGTAPGAVEFYRPVLDSMWQMFGPGRLIYASNWPVSELFAPLATVQSIVEDYCHSQDRAAEEQVLSLTSKAAYRWAQREKSNG